MKKHIHPNFRQGLTLLSSLVLLSLPATLWSQSAVHRPIEIGVMVRESIWNKQKNNPTGLREWTSFESSFATYFQVSGPRGRFLRVSAGLDTQQARGTLRQTQVTDFSERSFRTWLRTSAVYGTEIYPFEEGFGKRFGFRFGVGLEHAIQLQDQTLRDWIQTDTVSGGFTFENSSVKIWGNHQVSGLGMGQLNFRIASGFTIGLEWSLKLSLEIDNQHYSFKNTRGGTGLSTTTVEEEFSSGLGIGQLSHRSYPSLLLGWRF